MLKVAKKKGHYRMKTNIKGEQKTGNKLDKIYIDKYVN